jgi:hypothetical protein
MTLKDLIDLAGDRELSKSYPKADGLYIWDYKLIDATNLELITSDSGKTGFKDKVSIDEIIKYLKSEWAAGTVPYHSFDEIQITGVEGITIAKV